MLLQRPYIGLDLSRIYLQILININLILLALYSYFISFLFLNFLNLPNKIFYEYIQLKINSNQ